MKPLRVIFCGTPAFALPSLTALMAANEELVVVGVLTQPDKPSGRGQKVLPPPVKELAEAHGLQVKQPTSLRKEPEIIAWVKDLAPDFLVTAAFGQILSKEVLDIPRFGTVNVHASLLPKYRGPNPVQWAILNGDPEAGVTTMLTEIGVDTGPMLKRTATMIDPNENALSLVSRLATLGANILVPTLTELAVGTLKPQAQPAEMATHAPKLQKHDAVIDWSLPAITLHNKIRGQTPWPGTLTVLEGNTIKIHQSRHPATWPEASQYPQSGKPGTIEAIIHAGLVVQTGLGPLLIEQIQPPGKPVMSPKDWANGALRPHHSYCFETPSLP